jgi:hypothetical protein
MPTAHDPATPMRPQTDYLRHTAKLARKLQMDAGLGGGAQPDAEFWKALAKALDECAQGLEALGQRGES